MFLMFIFAGKKCVILFKYCDGSEIVALAFAYCKVLVSCKIVL